MCASDKGHAEVVSALLQHEEIEVNLVNNYGYSDLILASVRGFTEVVIMLLQREEIEVNLVDNNGVSALFLAVRESEHPEIVAKLDAAGADLSVVSPYFNGITSAEVLAELKKHGVTKSNLLSSMRQSKFYFNDGAGERYLRNVTRQRWINRAPLVMSMSRIYSWSQVNQDETNIHCTLTIDLKGVGRFVARCLLHVDGSSFDNGIARLITEFYGGRSPTNIGISVMDASLGASKKMMEEHNHESKSSSQKNSSVRRSDDLKKTTLKPKRKEKANVEKATVARGSTHLKHRESNLPVLLSLPSAQEIASFLASKAVDVSSTSSPASSSSSSTTTSYTSLGINHPILLANLRKQDFEFPLPIQQVSAPLVLTRKNTLISAHTGSGKTLAFLLPILQNFLLGEDKLNAEGCEKAAKTSITIIAPGRELESQITDVARSLLQGADVNVMLAIGGT